MSNESNTEIEEVLAIAAVPKQEAIYKYEGPETTDYPVKFEGVNVDGVFSVDNPTHRITSQLTGTMYFVCEIGSEEEKELREMFDELDGDADLLDVLRRRLDALEGASNE